MVQIREWPQTMIRVQPVCHRGTLDTHRRDAAGIAEHRLQLGELPAERTAVHQLDRATTCKPVSLRSREAEVIAPKGSHDVPGDPMVERCRHEARRISRRTDRGVVGDQGGQQR